MRDEVEVMRVLRVPPMGQLVVVSGGRRLKRLEKAQDEKTRQILLAAIGELVTFAGGYERLVAAGVAPELPRAETTTLRDAEPLTPEQAAFLDSLEQDRVPVHEWEETNRLQSEIPTTSVERAAEPEIPQVNLVAEIDSILQKHVRADPVVAHRSIRLLQPPGGALRIEVDGRLYERPGDIDDDPVRDVIKRALKEWESR